MTDTVERFQPLFDPDGVVVAGASWHPGKCGFVALHNRLAGGYGGRVFATNREGGEVLGVPCARSVDELPDGAADLVFVCTPASANPGLLRACAAKGVGAAFVTSAGYGEAGEEGRRPRPSWWPWPTSSGSCWPVPTAREWCRRRPR